MSDLVTTQTVDALLRARSDANLTARIADLIAPISALATAASDLASAQAAIAAFQGQLFSFLQVPKQQEEITAFLASVTTTELVETS